MGFVCSSTTDEPPDIIEKFEFHIFASNHPTNTMGIISGNPLQKILILRLTFITFFAWNHPMPNALRITSEYQFPQVESTNKYLSKDNREWSNQSGSDTVCLFRNNLQNPQLASAHRCEGNWLSVLKPHWTSIGLLMCYESTFTVSIKT